MLGRRSPGRKQRHPRSASTPRRSSHHPPPPEGSELAAGDAGHVGVGLHAHADHAAFGKHARRLAYTAADVDAAAGQPHRRNDVVDQFIRVGGPRPVVELGIFSEHQPLLTGLDVADRGARDRATRRPGHATAAARSLHSRMIAPQATGGASGQYFGRPPPTGEAPFTRPAGHGDPPARGRRTQAGLSA